MSTVGNRTGITDATTAKTTTSDDAVVAAISDDGARIALWHPSTETITFVDAAGKPLLGGKIGDVRRHPGEPPAVATANLRPDERPPQIQNWDDDRCATLTDDDPHARRGNGGRGASTRPTILWDVLKRRRLGRLDRLSSSTGNGPSFSVVTRSLAAGVRRPDLPRQRSFRDVVHIDLDRDQ